MGYIDDMVLRILQETYASETERGGLIELWVAEDHRWYDGLRYYVYRTTSHWQRNYTAKDKADAVRVYLMWRREDIRLWP